MLVSVATDRNAELVVVGARDDRPIAERLRGTVATEVSKQAPCDVLIVRPIGDLDEFGATQDAPAGTKVG